MPVARKKKPVWRKRLSALAVMVLSLLAISQTAFQAQRFYKLHTPAPFENIYRPLERRFTINLTDRLELRRMVEVITGRYVLEIFKPTKADAKCVASFNNRPSVSVGVLMPEGTLVCMLQNPTDAELQRLCDSLNSDLLAYNDKTHLFICERKNAKISF